MMLSIFKKLLLARELEFERGKINLLKNPIVMTPVSSYMEVRRMLEKIDATSLLYQACKKSGFTYIKSLNEKFGLKKPHDLIKWGIDTITLAGWGITNVVDVDLKKQRSLVTLEDSQFAKYYGRSTTPIDDVFRGYYAATASLCFGEDIDAVETKCIAMGNHHCEFVAKKKKNFNIEDPLVKNQLEITNPLLRKALGKKHK